MSCFGQLKNLKCGKKRAQHLPKRKIVSTYRGGNILTGWKEKRVGENYTLRELGENVVEGENAGEWEENEERWEDDK